MLFGRWSKANLWQNLANYPGYLAALAGFCFSLVVVKRSKRVFSALISEAVVQYVAQNIGYEHVIEI